MAQSRTAPAQASAKAKKKSISRVGRHSINFVGITLCLRAQHKSMSLPLSRPCVRVAIYNIYIYTHTYTIFTVLNVVYGNNNTAWEIN